MIESRETFVNKFLYNSTSILLGNSVVIVLFSFPFNGYRGMFGRGVGDWTCVTESLCDYGNRELAE